MSEFASRLIEWQRMHGRQDLPWQRTRDPYRVWLSEIMLQQTQVATVIDYYARFLARFPDVAALAAAALDEVMPLWAGLGYYARARNLHACARVVAGRYGGVFPRRAATLAQLPGIGRSTAAAIAAFCFDERAPILDGNVKRVLARHFGVEGFPGQAMVERQLWALAGDLLPPGPDMPAYTQALMDLGATQCTARRPRCESCPARATCVALREDRVGALPAPRPVRAARLRQAYWLLALADDAVLLEQRAPSGLWGGLWVPPEFDDRTRMQAAARALGDGVLQALPARRHAFTHYTLEFTPTLLRLQAQRVGVEEPGRRWLPLVQADASAVPAPLRRLLNELAQPAPAVSKAAP